MDDLVTVGWVLRESDSEDEEPPHGRAGSTAIAEERAASDHHSDVSISSINGGSNVANTRRRVARHFSNAAVPQPSIIPGCGWWQNPIWNALEHVRRDRPLESKFRLKHISFCSGTMSEAYCFQVCIQN